MTEQYATVSEETKALITKFNNDGRIDLLCQLQTVTCFADLDQFVLEMTKAGIRTLCDLTEFAEFKEGSRTVLKVKFGVMVLLTVTQEREFRIEETSALQLAIRLHNHYETLAPTFGYETRLDTRQFDPTTPNGKLMVAVCERILQEGL